MPVERVLIDAARMELLANYLLGCPAVEKFYNDQDSALVALYWVCRGHSVFSEWTSGSHDLFVHVRCWG